MNTPQIYARDRTFDNVCDAIVCEVSWRESAFRWWHLSARSRTMDARVLGFNEMRYEFIFGLIETSTKK